MNTLTTNAEEVAVIGAQTSATPVTVSHYLFVARYNRSKWNQLSDDQKQAAHEAAEALFPEDNTPVKGLASKGTSDRIAQSFLSDLISKLQSPDYQALSTLGEQPAYQALANLAQDLYVDKIYATQPPTPPVGWMEIVGEQDFLTRIEQMNANGSALWKMYDIEIHSLDTNWEASTIHNKLDPLLGSTMLKGDKTTHEVYTFMTPRNWT